MAFHQLHDEPGTDVGFDPIVELDDGGVDQTRRGPGLPPNALAAGGIGGHFHADVLEGDGASQPLVVAMVDLRLGAGADHVAYPVGADFCGRRRDAYGIWGFDSHVLVSLLKAGKCWQETKDILRVHFDLWTQG